MLTNEHLFWLIFGACLYISHLLYAQIQYYIAREVDIEKPTEASPEFEILIYGNTAFMQTISLPIHFRYHAPAHKRWALFSNSIGICSQPCAAVVLNRMWHFFFECVVLWASALIIRNCCCSRRKTSSHWMLQKGKRTSAWIDSIIADGRRSSTM